MLSNTESFLGSHPAELSHPLPSFFVFFFVVTMTSYHHQHLLSKVFFYFVSPQKPFLDEHFKSASGEPNFQSSCFSTNTQLSVENCFFSASIYRIALLHISFSVLSFVNNHLFLILSLLSFSSQLCPCCCPFSQVSPFFRSILALINWNSQCNFLSNL